MEDDMNFPETLTIKVSKRVSARKTVVVDEQVPARFYGPLAVKKDSDATKYSKASYSITHRPTGLRVAGELNLNQAIRIAKQLQDMPEWNEPSLGEGRTAANTALFDRLRDAVVEAKRDHDADHDYNIRRKWRI
jgi:hypothetical protein